MARKRVSARNHARKFNKNDRRNKAVNSPRNIPRGGIRF